MDSLTLIFLSGVINRLTEVLKRAFLNDLPWTDDRKGALILLLSLFLGVLGVALLFPATNLFQGLGASALAEQIATGIAIGGLANGIDFLAKSGNAAMDRLVKPDDTVSTRSVTVVAKESS